MGINLSSKLFSLQFKHPFGVSSNTRTETISIFIKLELKEFTGYGEACLPAYLGETAEDTFHFFEKAKILLEKKNEEITIDELLQETDKLSSRNNAAKAALDIALHDLYAKIAGKSVREYLDLKTCGPLPTSITIGIDVEEVLEKKIKAAEEFSVLKIKAGTKNDQELINLIRKYTDKPLYVDVNQGWTDKMYVLEMAQWMKDQNVILLEQPMPVGMKEEMYWVTERSPIPTIADESVKRLKDLEVLNGSFSGVNIKLMKSTGLSEAMKMIDFCKKNNLKILLGCMAESSCATSAMAQLAGLGDYIDLDAPLLYKNDPFDGLRYRSGSLFLKDLPGIGALPKMPLFD